jgi:hypothetical protein
MIQSIEDFLTAIRTDSSSWHPKEPKWFRGEPESKSALLPTLYRENLAPHENALLQMFRARASGYHDLVPGVGQTDQWLALARHAGLPTRLLDWTEGALIALHFALKEKYPIIWMLNPLGLNHLSDPSMTPDSTKIREFFLPWHNPSLWGDGYLKVINPAFENIRGAWEQDQCGVELPVAFYPTYVHPRLRGQRACFTIHGRRKDGLSSLVPDALLKRYTIDPDCRQSLIQELRVLGITDSVVFPDLDGLASELKAQF